MNSCLTTLGISLPLYVTGRRKLTLTTPPCFHPFHKRSFLHHRDSLLCLLDHKNLPLSSCSSSSSLIKEGQGGGKRTEAADDDTASTLSESSSMDDSSSCSGEPICPAASSTSSTSRVTFAEPLVTAMYTRPKTMPHEKYHLHYNEFDYLDFKMEYITGRGRCKRVQFQQDIQIREIPSPSRKERQVLYYSELELQQFLDDFVYSLNERLAQEWDDNNNNNNNNNVNNNNKDRLNAVSCCFCFYVSSLFGLGRTMGYRSCHRGRTHQRIHPRQRPPMPVLYDIPLLLLCTFNLHLMDLGEIRKGIKEIGITEPIEVTLHILQYIFLALHEGNTSSFLFLSIFCSLCLSCWHHTQIYGNYITTSVS